MSFFVWYDMVCCALLCKISGVMAGHHHHHHQNPRIQSSERMFNHYGRLHTEKGPLSTPVLPAARADILETSDKAFPLLMTKLLLAIASKRDHSTIAQDSTRCPAKPIFWRWMTNLPFFNDKFDK